MMHVGKARILASPTTSQRHRDSGDQNDPEFWGWFLILAGIGDFNFYNQKPYLASTLPSECTRFNAWEHAIQNSPILLEGRTPLLLPFSFGSLQPITSFWGEVTKR